MSVAESPAALYISYFSISAITDASCRRLVHPLPPEHSNESSVSLLFFCHLLKKIPLQCFTQSDQSLTQMSDTQVVEISQEILSTVLNPEGPRCKVLLKIICKRNLAKEKSRPSSPKLDGQVFRGFLSEGSFPRHLQLYNICLLLNCNGTRNGSSTACSFSGKCF